jgi:hypothetical protein
MAVKRFILLLTSLFLLIQSSFCQEKKETGSGIIFRGLVLDGSTLSPIPNSQIYINNTMKAVSGSDGSFTFFVNRSDTVIFNSLGYKITRYHVSDTLKGMEFNAGIFMRTDTVEIGEVIIIPRQSTLRSEIMNAPMRTSSILDNARSNVAISAYQGRTTHNQLGDPLDNYAVISQKQRTMAYEKGGIPSEQTVAISPFLIIPAAYLLIKGFPESPSPMKSTLTHEEVDKIHRKYLEIHKNQNK